MQVHFGVELLHAEWPHAVTCIGTFDGVHRGHQAVISTAVQRAIAEELPCALVTFDRHPAHVLAPDRAPKAIASLAANLEQFAALGVSVAVILPFDRALSETSAQAFLDEILIGRLRSHELVVGHDFALGHGREGNPAWLAGHLTTHVVPPFELEGRRVSSSDIRRAIQEGEVESAAHWLGRPFEIPGVVVGGQKLGRTLGYPTINIARSFDQVMLADGVYAAWCESSRGIYKAALAIGTRPAVGGEHRTIEAYLLDYPGDSLYGYSVRLRLVRRLREERNFPSLDALKDQMAKDVAEVAASLA